MPFPPPDNATETAAATVLASICDRSVVLTVTAPAILPDDPSVTSAFKMYAWAEPLSSLRATTPPPAKPNESPPPEPTTATAAAAAVASIEAERDAVTEMEPYGTLTAVRDESDSP